MVRMRHGIRPAEDAGHGSSNSSTASSARTECPTSINNFNFSNFNIDTTRNSPPPRYPPLHVAPAAS